MSNPFGAVFPRGIGVLFDIGALGGGYYGHKAWRVFMRNVAAKDVLNCLLVDGDTTASITGGRDQFCIGIYGDGADFRDLRRRFEIATDQGLASMPARIMEKPALDVQPLAEHGRVDPFGRLLTKNWDAGDLQLCEEFGWGYLPQDAPDWLHLVLEKLNSRV